MSDKVAEKRRFNPLAILLLPLALMLAYSGMRLSVQDFTFTELAAEVGFWGRADYHPDHDRVEDVGRSLDLLLQAQPRHPDYLSLQASYFSWRAYWSKGQQERRRFNDNATESQYRALLARPAHRHGWRKMVEYASRTTTGAAMLQTARERADALAPARP